MTHSTAPSPRILLVDDLAMFRRLLPARLGALAPAVESVANVDEARAYLETKRPDLILLDVILPGTDGFTYCRELKADPALAAIPVVMLTDLAREAGDRSIEAGADDYMPKRIDDAIMRIRVNLHLHLGALGGGGEHRLPAGPAQVLVASATSQLRAQITNQFTRDGHTVRGVETLPELRGTLGPSDQVLVLDLGLGFNAAHEFLVELRQDPHRKGLPVLLIASKEEVRHLESLEHLVDDVLWTPLKAKVFSQRLTYLLKLGRRGR